MNMVIGIVEVRTVFFDPVNSLVSGDMDEQAWIDGRYSCIQKYVQGGETF